VQGIRKEHITIRINPDAKMQLKELADIAGGTISNLINLSIDMMLEKAYNADGFVKNLNNHNPFIIDMYGKKYIDGYFDVAKVANISGINPNTIRTWIKRNKIKTISHNNRYYVKLRDVYGKNKCKKEW
jgi:hypothetical protein